jgi:P-type Ca2+ transporter type 2C
MNEIDLDSMSGLSDRDVSIKLKEEGYNELPAAGKKSIFGIVFSVLKDPIFLLLVASGSLYFILGDATEGLVLLSFVFVIIGITVYQEEKTEKALDALQSLSSPRALVIREGRQKRIPGREVVVGDIVILSEGDRVPADILLLSSNNLLVDEALLTGESVPVRKMAWDGEEQSYHPGGDDLPTVYSGTLVIQGQAIGEVKKIGLNTEMGKIGAVLQKVEDDETRLKKEINQIVRNMAVIGLTLCFVVIIVYGFTRLDWIDGFLAGITLAMAILPEEFPVVLTIFLALGAWRMSKHNVLTRKMHAIENLGIATVLCVDKTGTLTQNKMSISKLFANGRLCNVQSSMKLPPDYCHELVEFSVLACKEDPFDPMEKAIRSFTQGEFAETEHVHDDWKLVHEYPLSKKLLAMSNVWVSPNGEDYIIAAKGAPEAIGDLCHLDTKRLSELSFDVQTMAIEGLRVLGVAKASFKKTDLPAQQHDFDFKFVGLVGFADPVRDNIAEAIKEAYTAGIRVVMITGDFPSTAQNIGKQIGLKSPENCITGPELDKMSDKELQERIKTVNIFARVVPEQKFRIVNAFKANNDVVAMTGDGVNDAPALKSANIGIAMGGKGTDVARESSSMVLVDDNFTSIVSGVKMGRRIYDNLKKAIAYIFAVHIPIAGMSVIPVLLGWPLILFPVHIVFLELIIDPACSVVFEMEEAEAGIMKRKPRNIDKKLFNKEAAIVSFVQGAVVLAIVALLFFEAIQSGLGEQTARTMAFATIVMSNLALILVNRSWEYSIIGTLRKQNKAFWWVLAIALIALVLVIYIPPFGSVFSFSALTLVNLLICTGAAIFSIIWFEIYKVVKKTINGRGFSKNL